MNYAYLRISTKRQKTEHQKEVIVEYCQNNNIHIDHFFRDVISGKLKIAKRKQFSNLLRLVEPGDTIVVRDLSRLGRNLKDVIDNVWDFKDKGIDVISIKEGINSKMNKIQWITTVSIFAMVSQIEREFISERTRDALADRKGKGILGRPSKMKGKKVSKSSLKKAINEYLKEGLSIAEISKLLGVHYSTVYRNK